MKGLQKSLAEASDSMGASEDFKAVLLETLCPFLEENEFGENDGPILVVEPLVHMPKDKIDAMMDALDRHAENINGAGICYKFSSHKALKDAKELPEHVKKVHDPYVHTRVITAYDRANDHLVHEDCDFFVC